MPVALAGFGVGAFLGVSLAARAADTHYRTLVAGGGVALLVGWVALALLAGRGPVATLLALVAVMGMVAFAVGSAVIARSLSLAADAPTMGGSFTTAALNVGATLGPVLGGAGLAAGPSAPPWTAAVLVALAAAPAAVTLVRERTGGVGR